MSLFQINNLVFRYGDKTVLDIPDLTIEEGGMVCLTGANGSGKSTLLNLLAGLLRPSCGRLIYRGTDIVEASPDIKNAVRREMGVSLQSPYLFRTTVEGNVSYGLAARGTPKEEREQKVRSALLDVGLEGFAKRPWHALSGGEAQRVGLARALAVEPRVLLLDEPMANVDAVTRLFLERILEKLIRERGITTIISTHDIDQALRLGRQIITLHGGNIVESGLENIFHGTLRQEDHSWVFDTGRCLLAVAPHREDARTAIIPPESILLSLDRLDSSARNTLKGTVNGIRMRNGSVEVTVSSGEQFTALITRASLEKMGLHLGMGVWLIIKAEAVKLY